MIARLEALLYGPDRRGSVIGFVALVMLAAVAVSVAIGVAGPLYAIAGFAVAIGALLILRDLRWGVIALLAVIGVVPFGALPFKLGFTPTFMDVALLAVCTVWILRLATRREEDLRGSPIGALVLLFVFLALFSFANGLRYGMPTSTTIRNFAELVLAILFFFVVLNMIRSRAELDFFARLLLLAGAAAGAIAIMFYVIPEAWTVRVLDALGRFNYPGGYGALRYIEDDSENPMRAIGTMVDPNVLGGFMILMGGLAAAQVVSKQPVFPRRWTVLICGIILLALYLTYSRGSLAGLAAGVFLIALLRYRKLLWIGIVGVALLLLLPVTQEYVTHFIEGIQLEDRATLMRLGEYKDALSLIRRYPWFGVGFAGSPDADLYVGVSNLYLLITEEMGLLGLTAFLGVVVAFFQQLWRAWRRTMLGGEDPRMEAILLGIGASISGVMVGGLLDHYLFNLVYPHMSTLFWMFLGVGMSATMLTTRGEQPGDAAASHARGCAPSTF